MNFRQTITGHLPRRAPLSAAIAAVTLTLAGPAVLASEDPTDAADPRSQAQSQTDSGTQSHSSGSPTQSFTALDQDGNGYLSENELQASQSPRANIDNLDSDSDGKVSQSEFAAMETGAMGSGQSTAGQSASSESTWSQSASSQSASSETGSDAGASGQSEQAKAVAKIAEQQQSLTTFTEALQKTGMADALTDQTQYTIFAPTNDAFQSHSGKSAEELMKPENRQELVSLLRAHIVADDVDTEMAGTIGEARTIDGGTVSLAMENDKLQVGDAAVVESSFQQGSLRVYPIDGVLEPQAGTQTASTSGSTSAQQTGSSSSATGSSDPQSQTAADTSATGSAMADLQNKAFSELDQDGDGYLNQDELKSAAGTTAADTATNQLDTDQDGQLSRSEFAAFEQSQGQSSDQSGQSWEPESDPQHDQQ